MRPAAEIDKIALDSKGVLNETDVTDGSAVAKEIGVITKKAAPEGWDVITENAVTAGSHVPAGMNVLVGLDMPVGMDRQVGLYVLTLRRLPPRISRSFSRSRRLPPGMPMTWTCTLLRTRS